MDALPPAPQHFITGHLEAAGFRSGNSVGWVPPSERGNTWRLYPIEPESWPEGAVECTQVHWTVRDSWQRFQAARHDWDASHALGADLREAYRLLTMALEKLGYTVTYREKPDRWGTYEWIEVYAMAGQVTEPSAT